MSSKADIPNRWTDLTHTEQDDARRISQQVDVPTASVSQVGKWLDAFHDYADGRITSAELYERTDHAHGSPEGP